MNIYRTKNRRFYINIEQIVYVEVFSNWVTIVSTKGVKKITLFTETGKAFLDYLDNHLEGVYAGVMRQ